jgi:hypothetical protein
VPLSDLRGTVHREALAMVDGNGVDYSLNGGGGHIFLFDMYDVGTNTLLEAASRSTFKLIYI